MRKYVLMNKRTGEVAVGIPFNYAEQPQDQYLCNLDGYVVSLRPKEPDAWALQCSENAVMWTMVTGEWTMHLEKLCEL